MLRSFEKLCYGLMIFSKNSQKIILGSTPEICVLFLQKGQKPWFLREAQEYHSDQPAHQAGHRICRRHRAYRQTYDRQVGAADHQKRRG
ncbi:hypothetical protein [Mesorhizobium sp. B2-4-4]|uniref:hypothetical protein n=1 Tax=Mesorhizobium sp. B2-4-4 TaxID=2589945 RepID=UPI0015E46F13|nr:hypothetical protein [Mesorhizobium sp. B2-4-4]